MLGGGFGYGMMGWGMLVVGLGWVLVIIAIMALVVWAVRSTQAHAIASGESALDILKMRYAKGEITKEQFDSMKRDLS